MFSQLCTHRETDIKGLPTVCELSTTVSHLNAWLLSSDTAWEGCGTFKKWSLVGASGSLRADLELL